MCYRIDTKRLLVERTPYLGGWSETGAYVNGYGGMIGIANETVFHTREHAVNALRASITRQLRYHARRLAVLTMALSKFEGER